MQIDENDLTAYHEAGHAVAANVLGVEFTKVSAEPNAADGTLGSFHFGVRQGHRPESIVTLSGVAAQKRRAAELGLPRAAGVIGVERDIWDAMDEAAYRRDGNGDLREHAAEVSEITAEADELVECHWDGISAIAAELLAKGSLTSSEVAGVLAIVRREQCP